VGALRAQRDEHVPQEEQEREAEDERADRLQQIDRGPARLLGVVGDAPGHALDAHDVHREEGEIRSDEQDREVQLPEVLAQTHAGPLGEPVIDPREEAHHRPAEQDVVDVGHDPVRVLDREVDRR
jgi:hypothetical protein